MFGHFFWFAGALYYKSWTAAATCSYKFCPGPFRGGGESYAIGSIGDRRGLVGEVG